MFIMDNDAHQSMAIGNGHMQMLVFCILLIGGEESTLEMAIRSNVAGHAALLNSAVISFPKD
jgi:hypothetical protein